MSFLWRIDPVWWDDRYAVFSIPDEDLCLLDPEFDDGFLPVRRESDNAIADLGYVSITQAFYCKAEHEEFWRSRPKLNIKWYDLPANMNAIRVFSTQVRTDVMDHEASQRGGDLQGHYIRQFLDSKKIPLYDLFGGVGRNDSIFCTDALYKELKSLKWKMALDIYCIPVVDSRQAPS